MTPRNSSARQASTRAGPVGEKARIATLDVLRGFALLGILLANIQDFASAAGILHDIPLEVISLPGTHHAWDVAVMTGQWLFVEGKMRALFGTLFGAGTALLLSRIEISSGAGIAADVFHRRNMWLLAFGVLHGALIWSGDILFFYGSLSLLVLYPLRNVRPRRLICWGFAISLLGSTVGLGTAFDAPSAWPAATLQERAVVALQSNAKPAAAEQRALTDAQAQRQREVDALPAATAANKGGYLRTFGRNFAGWTAFLGFVFSSGWILEVTGILIAGMGLYGVGFLSGGLSSRVYLLVAGVGYAIALPLVLNGLYHASQTGFSDAVMIKWLFGPYGVQQIAGMLANSAIVILAVKHGTLLWLQKGLAAVGRMALTNYIATSVLCQFIFKWGPWQLFGTLEYHQQIYFVVGIWTVNLIGSVLWLRIFLYGPLEWVWRSLTYWKMQPMLRMASSTA